MKKVKLIIICGPTGVGKTSLALQLAEKLPVEIISADSRQIYKCMNIGTAKPTSEELRSVPHHLINIITPDEKFTAGEFVKRADEAIALIYERKHIPFIVGGTGFYIKSLLYGLCKISEIPAEIRSNLKNEIEEKGSEKLHEELTEVDPIASQKIDKNDGNRIIRALEVYRETGIPISSYWHRDALEQRYEYFTVYLNEERQVLYDKINKRVDRMIADGLFDEFKDLLDRGFAPYDPGLNSIGYKEFIDFIEEKQDWNSTIELIKQHMRNYSKRQCTWFNKQQIDLTISPSNLTICDIEKEIKKYLGLR